MPKKKERLNSEKTELAKTIAERSQSIVDTSKRATSKVGQLGKWMSSWIDRILFSQKHGKAIALIVAVLLYTLLNAGVGKNNFIDSNKRVLDLHDVPVEVMVSKEAYEVSGIPKTVKVTIIGELSDLQLVKQNGNYQVVADLTSLSEGVHEVILQAENFSEHVDVKIEPSTVMVTIKKKETNVFAIGYDFVNTDKMKNIYQLSEPEFAQEEVYVRASKETIDEIAYVKALIDVSGVEKEFEIDAPLVAYNQDGDKMNVEIIPKTIRTKVKVSVPKKEVPIVIVPIGTIPNNQAIASYTLDQETVTVYAPEAILNNLENIPITIPASTLTQDMSFTMPLVKPNGVNELSLSDVSITVKLAAKEKKTFASIPITIMNLNEDFKVVYLDPKDAVVDVNVLGVKNILDSIQSSDIEVFIDCKNIKNTANEIEATIHVKGKNNLVQYEVVKTKIVINIEKK